jgi:Ca2+-binding RTX toxin-like protein
MSSTRRLALPAALALLGIAAAPAQATLEVSSNATDGLIVLDKSGAIVFGDRVTISTSTSGGEPVYLVTSTNPADLFKFDFKLGCAAHPTAADTAICVRLRGKLNLRMEGGNDNVQTPNTAGVTEASVNLGNGDDVYSGIEGANNVFPGGGSDNITTRGGVDSVTVVAGGTDTVTSGSGNDRISEFSGATSPTGGQVTVSAGNNNDTISLASRYARIRAFLGSGNDSVTADSFDAIVNGDSGNDTLTTGRGADNVDGGLGVDTISTGLGADFITSREASGTSSADNVRCGLGADQVTADLADQVDAISNAGGGTCEDVDISPVRETPHVRIGAKTLRVSPAGNVDVLLRCPRGVRRLGCDGTLQLRIDRRSGGDAQGSRSDRVRYRIRAGRRTTVRLQLSPADVRTLRRRRGRETRGILVSVEEGVKGLKTTVRNPRLRLRKG